MICARMMPRASRSRSSKRAGPATLTMDAADPDGRYLNDLETQMTVIDPQLGTHKLPLVQMLLGRYTAGLPSILPCACAYHLELTQKEKMARNDPRNCAGRDRSGDNDGCPLAAHQRGFAAARGRGFRRAARQLPRWFLRRRADCAVSNAAVAPAWFWPRLAVVRAGRRAAADRSESGIGAARGCARGCRDPDLPNARVARHRLWCAAAGPKISSGVIITRRIVSVALPQTAVRCRTARPLSREVGL